MGKPKPVHKGPTPPEDLAGVQHTEILSFEGPRAELVTEWAERMNGAGTVPSCACGCGGKVIVREKHRSIGLPRFLHGHHPNPLQRGFERMRQRGYRLVGEVAATLGVSATTLRRMEVEGAIPKAKRIDRGGGKTVRAYTVAQVTAMVRSRARERWRETHPGRWRR